jgi:hypothetical protein
MKNQVIKNHISETKASVISDAINEFSKSQTLLTVGKLRNLGVGLKVLTNNKWQTLHEYKLPFEKFIPLYSDDFKICDIGVY